MTSELLAPCSTSWTTGTLSCSWTEFQWEAGLPIPRSLFFPGTEDFHSKSASQSLWRHARASKGTARGLQADAINHLDGEDWRSDSGWFHWRSDLGFTTSQRPEWKEPQFPSNELELWRFSGKAWGKRKREKKKPSINRKDAQPLSWWGHWEVFLKLRPKALQSLSECQPCSWVD